MVNPYTTKSSPLHCLVSSNLLAPQHIIERVNQGRSFGFGTLIELHSIGSPLLSDDPHRNRIGWNETRSTWRRPQKTRRKKGERIVKRVCPRKFTVPSHFLLSFLSFLSKTKKHTRYNGTNQPGNHRNFYSKQLNKKKKRYGFWKKTEQINK